MKKPKKVAKELIDSGCTIEQYQSVQFERIKRLGFWKEKGIEVLIKNETKLVNFGQKILNAMRDQNENV